MPAALLERKHHEIDWIYKKLQQLSGDIDKNYPELKEQWKQELLEFARERSSELNKNSNFSLAMTLNANISERLPDHGLFWALDTLIIDVKRLLLNSVHLIDCAVRQTDSEDTKLQFENFLTQISSVDSGKQERAMIGVLKKDHPEFVKAVNAMWNDLKSANDLRSFLEHGRLSGHVKKTTYTLEWSAKDSLDDPPKELTNVDLEIQGSQIADYAKNQIQLCKKFSKLCGEVADKIANDPKGS